MNTSNEETTAGTDLVILLVSGSCCVPWMAVHDQQAQQVIRQALAEIGVTAEIGATAKTSAKAVIKVVPVSSALQGGIPQEILKGLDLQAQRANLGRLPALFINGKLIGFGVPELEVLKMELRLALSAA